MGVMFIGDACLLYLKWKDPKERARRAFARAKTVPIGEAAAHLQGVDWHIWGENVGYTPQDVTSIQEAFMGSPPHRSNILNRGFRQVAIGTVRVDGTLWVTVFFYG